MQKSRTKQLTIPRGRCRVFDVRRLVHLWFLLWLFTQVVAAEETPQDRAQVSDEKTAKFHAGLRKFKFTYLPPGEKEAAAARQREDFLWYPTAENAPEYDYKPLAGFAAENAKVALGQHPLLLFSHGFLGAADQTIFLTEELARQGYIVAALDHADALRFKREKQLEIPDFANAQAWDDKKFIDRRDDIVALLEHLLKLNGERGTYLQGHLDQQAIGVVGHSLGGYTALGLAGGWSSWHDKRIRAIVALSPYSTPYLVHGNLAEVSIPVMLQGGTWDFGITPFLPSIYDRLTCSRYYLELKNETHFGWTNLVSLGKTTKECCAQGNPELITRYTILFFDKTLRGVHRPQLTAAEPRLEKSLAQEEGGKTSGNGSRLLELSLQRKK